VAAFFYRGSRKPFVNNTEPSRELGTLCAAQAATTSGKGSPHG
jgi:hypothetical protein